jgi:type I restriction enzyme M protein
LNERDLSEFLSLQRNHDVSDNAWILDVSEIDESTVDLSVRNPNKLTAEIHREPDEILSELMKIDSENLQILTRLKEFL